MLKKKRIALAGFTLVELLVSISIFAVITALVMFKYNRFNGSILLTNLAYDVALTIRQAQVYGLNVRETAINSNNFTTAYGAHFDTANSTTFIFFVDSNGNKQYDTSEAVSTYVMKKGNRINTLCSGTSAVCNAVTSLDILFKRPYPEAIINSNLSTSASYSEINLISGDNTASQKIVVQKTGQISIE